MCVNMGKMSPKFGINFGVLFFFLINNYCWLTVIVQAKSHHHRSHHDDDHSKSHHRSRHIHGSLPAHPGRWKFMALIKIPTVIKGQSYVCSAILINNRSLLTAAHCLDEHYRKKPIRVLLKGLSLNSYQPGRDRDLLKKTFSYKMHDKFLEYHKTPKREPYDIAIVKLETPIVLDPAKGIDKVDLPIAPDGKQYPFDPNNCYMVGYGKETPAYPDHRLQEVKVPMMPRDVCRKYVQIEKQICIGYPGKRKCPKTTIPKLAGTGDSGGAFLCKTIHFHTGKHRKLPKYILIAMSVSIDDGYKKQDCFTVANRVLHNLDWIKLNS